ncbi:uncharacterized protein BCR38DRAFT_450915 [Pseudomassariella vexata]|uniref:AA1-like domain-containing protein n=1 Tax=Pseudomassariella vexata TaxID=1141098 RepID=A0A1Y2DBQ6_9PEZI|nr:uncharacterized protein BCR38DRAFT_450915 [Pseudomassariella vexata]ORY56700.1 hypothetical protein BCR38DRAFT_450915 [Pseudomassariella vexata]
MHFITLTTTLLFAATGLAAPSAPQVQGRTYDTVHIEFQGAADAKFDLDIATDGNRVSIGNQLSISHIVSYAPEGVECHFLGVEGSQTYTSGYQTVDVGPPQPQLYASCS